MRRSVPGPLANEEPTASRRRQQLTEVLRRLLADFIERELEFPRGALVTVSNVHLAEDFSEARIGISVLPVQLGESCLEVIVKAAWEIQRQMGKKFTAYRVPRLSFFLDLQLEKTDHIERLLDTVHEKE